VVRKGERTTVEKYLRVRAPMRRPMQLEEEKAQREGEEKEIKRKE